MTQYDPKVIYRFANGLYSRAQFLVLVYTISGVLVGGGLGAAYTSLMVALSSFSNSSLGGLGSIFGQSATPTAVPPPANWTLIGALVAGLIGLWIGSNRAFALKLQAQSALCQVKIEENTNPARNGRT